MVLVLSKRELASICSEVYKEVSLGTAVHVSYNLQAFRVVFIVFQYPFDISLRHPGVEISDKLSVFFIPNGLKQEKNREHMLILHMRGVIAEERFKLAMETRKRDMKRKDTCLIIFGKI